MITHRKTSAIPDAGDSSLVQPSDWNDTHVVTISEATLDFGTKPIYNKSFTVTDAECTASSKIIITQQAVTDEAEFDMICYAAKAGDGSFTVYSSAMPGPVSGTRKINYFIGV